MDHKRPAIVLDDSVAGWHGTRGYVENVAAAITLAVADERASARIYNVGGAHALPKVEWVRAIGRLVECSTAANFLHTEPCMPPDDEDLPRFLAMVYDGGVQTLPPWWSTA